MTGISTLATARALGDELRAILQAETDPTTDGPFKVETTMANTTAGGALAAGAVVALILPPQVTFYTYAQHTAAWTVLLCAGPEQNPETAWERLDAAVDALAVPLDLDTFRPVTFQDVQGPQWPAFELTLTTEHTHN